jgi:hypothetical protein
MSGIFKRVLMWMRNKFAVTMLWLSAIDPIPAKVNEKDY